MGEADLVQNRPRRRIYGVHWTTKRPSEGSAELMVSPLHHPHELSSNSTRELASRFEPRALRTYTPTQAVLARSAGIYHWTPEGRRLYDFTSGVLVANLGHNPSSWLKRYTTYMGWPD